MSSGTDASSWTAMCYICRENIIGEEHECVCCEAILCDDCAGNENGCHLCHYGDDKHPECL